MNRIPQLAPNQDLNVDAPRKVEQALLSGGVTRGRGRVSFFAPMHYEANYEYPLLVWLHGPRDDERQLLRVMPLISMRNYAAVAPRGSSCHERGDRFTWYQSETGISHAETCVMDAIDAACERFSIAPDRLFLGGYDCGGTMAFRVGMKFPDRFAGVVSLGGPFPTEHTPLARIDEARRLPLFIAHGRTSQEYSVHRTCDELRLFHAAGMSITLRQYPCGEELTTRMLHDVNVWLMEQITGASMGDEEPESLYRPGESN